MAQLAARWRRSKLVTLVTLRKGNHVGGIREKGPKKSFIQKTKGDSLERPLEEAEIQRKAFRR